MSHSPTGFLLLVCALLFAGCATVRTNDTGTNNAGVDSVDPIDPNEKINRQFYNFTDMVDRTIMAPVADAYIKYVPDRMQRSIGNFYDNLGYPNVILNDFLQGKVRQGFEDSLRFAVNSTIGLGGLFDMAAPMGLPQHDEDFGQTLAVWGFNTGSYLFVPLIGPSTYRDAPGIPVSVFSNLLFYAGSVASTAVVGPITVLSIIDRRARLSGPMRLRDQAALDPYLFVREGFLQQRKHLIYDGDPPPESFDDVVDEDSIENDGRVGQHREI
jgi:phospholipid-binding lipoprotein MlaA